MSIMSVPSKKDQKFVGGFALSRLLGSGRASMLPLGTLSLGLWVVAEDPASSQVTRTSRLRDLNWSARPSPCCHNNVFLKIFSEHLGNKRIAHLMHLRFLANNCVYSSQTDIKLCTYCLYRHTTVVIDEILYLANQLGCSDLLTPPHLTSSLTDTLPSLNLLCHSKTDARLMQDGPKAVWGILYVSVGFL